MRGASIRTAASLAVLLAAIPAAAAQSAPAPVDALSAFEQSLIEYIVLGIIGLFAAAAVVGVATTAGFLPEKRTGVWRIFTVIDWLGGVICLLSSFGSSSSGSSSSGSTSASGSGGSFGGGGSKGNW
jgi:uncharacterized membrane protein YgcG